MSQSQQSKLFRAHFDQCNLVKFAHELFFSSSLFWCDDSSRSCTCLNVLCVLFLSFIGMYSYQMSVLKRYMNVIRLYFVDFRDLMVIVYGRDDSSQFLSCDCVYVCYSVYVLNYRFELNRLCYTII